jgi:hypothetical protein
MMDARAPNYPDTTSNMDGYIIGSHFAKGYYSDFTQRTFPQNKLPLLAGLNCSYLSHPNAKAPTLVELKKHAQALCILIRHLCVTTRAGEIDGENSTARDGEHGQDNKPRLFHENEAFDFLGNLDEPYENDDESHHLPLTNLLNMVHMQTDFHGPESHCPLREFAPTDEMDPPPPTRPYASHHNLLMHANECLEMLDHEYSATGGIMSILPSDTAADTKDMQAARNSLFGQWLCYNQHLVGRMHELEISYGRALDALAGEANVACQTAGRGFPTKDSGRIVAYPQDRWILCNAGDDVFDYLHRLMDIEEAQVDQRERQWRQAGVSGERMWNRFRGGDDYARGLVPLDVVTRFYRLKDTGRGSTIFVLPAYEFHPGCQHTHRVETRPGVVSVPAPLWPERVSEWEARHRTRLDEAARTSLQNTALLGQMDGTKVMMDTVAEELRKANRLLKHYEASVGGDAAGRLRELERELDGHKQKLSDLRTVLPEEYHQQLKVGPTAGAR